MRLTLTEPKYLKDSISIISELVNEARFKVTKESIELVRRTFAADIELFEYEFE